MIIEISKDEAIFIADLLSVVGGSPKNTRRAYADSLLDKLEDSGIYWDNSPYRAGLAGQLIKDMQIRQGGKGREGPKTVIYFTNMPGDDEGEI